MFVKAWWLAHRSAQRILGNPGLVGEASEVGVSVEAPCVLSFYGAVDGTLKSWLAQGAWLHTVGENQASGKAQQSSEEPSPPSSRQQGGSGLAWNWARERTILSRILLPSRPPRND